MSIPTVLSTTPTKAALMGEFTSYWGARKAISAAKGKEQQQLITWCLTALADVANPRAERMKMALLRMQKQETPIQETFSLDSTGNLTQVKAKKSEKAKSGKGKGKKSGKKAKAAKIQAKATSASESSDRSELAAEITAMVLAALAAKGL